MQDLESEREQLLHVDCAGPIDVEAVKRFEARTKDHPAGNMHAFIGFSDIKKLEEEFLPSAEVLAKYEGSVGFQP